MRLTFICGHTSSPMRRKVAIRLPVGSMAWCVTCHDIRQVTKSLPNAQPPKQRGK